MMVRMAKEVNMDEEVSKEEEANMGVKVEGKVNIVVKVETKGIVVTMKKPNTNIESKLQKVKNAVAASEKSNLIKQEISSLEY